MPSDISDGELTDALLDLVDTTTTRPKKKRKHASTGSKGGKRHKRDLDVSGSDAESEDEPESEEDSNPYPLEGKYKDHADRDRILQMSEIAREEELARRAEELQKFQDRFNLSQLVKAQSGHADASVSAAAKRKHTVRGATKEKADKLNEYKAKRKAKDERKSKAKASSPIHRDSASDDDMDISDGSSEDGEINKDAQLEERARNVFDKAKDKGDDPKVECADFELVMLDRVKLLKYHDFPWFADYVKGAYVRYLIGADAGVPVYRICEITNIPPEPVKPYKCDDKTLTQLLELKHGKYVKSWPMDKVSNSRATEKEINRLISTLEYEKVIVPRKKDFERKAEQMKECVGSTLTEIEVANMIAKRAAGKPSRAAHLTSKSRLIAERKLAIAREDFSEAAEIEGKLKAIEELESQRPKEEGADAMAKVNERNRQRNLEAIRKMEGEIAARKKAERKGLLEVGTQDPTARVKQGPKMVQDKSRPGTPSQPGTPHLTANGKDGNARSVSPMPGLTLTSSAMPTKSKSSFEENMLSVEIDLGDF